MTAFVAQFIGESSRLRGRILSIEGERCVVETRSGARILALPVRGEAGACTTISIRPERVILDPVPGQCENVFDARVEELIYHGDHVRVHLRVCGERGFVVKVPNVERKRSLSAGDVVRIGWRVRDCRALNDG